MVKRRRSTKPSSLSLYDSIASVGFRRRRSVCLGKGGGGENDVDGECLYRLGCFCEEHVLMSTDF